MSALRGSESGSDSGNQVSLQTLVSSVIFLPPGNRPCSLSSTRRPNARLVHALLLEQLLTVLSGSRSLYHSPTTCPLRITRRALAPSICELCFHARASLSQSTPVVSAIFFLTTSSGSPFSGTSERHPPLSSGGGK